MKFLIALLMGILVFGLINNTSLLNIGLILLGVYLLFNLLQGAKDNASKLKDFVDVKDLGLDKLKCPDGIVDNMLKDAGKATNGLINGKVNPELGKAIAKGTYKTIDGATTPFKN